MVLSKWEKEWSAYRLYFKETDIGVFNIGKNAAILDLGCGDGWDLKTFKKLGYKNVKGIDPSEFLVKKCKEQGFDAETGDMRNLRFNDNSFDCVFVNGVFHHIVEYEQAFKEIRRVLKKNGLLCAIEPRKTVLRMPIDFMTNYLPISKPLRARRKILREEKPMMRHWLKNQKSTLKLLKKYFDMLMVENSWFFINLKCLVKK